MGDERRVVVITGAAGGIGLGIGRAFASSGASVVLSDIDQSRLDSAVASMRDRGSSVLGVRCDVRSADSVLALRDAMLDRFGTVDVVCLNAGSVTPRATLEVTSRDWEAGLAANLFGVVHIASGTHSACGFWQTGTDAHAVGPIGPAADVGGADTGNVDRPASRRGPPAPPSP